jgi:tetratricopeptide (TPR) repeat protein
MMLDNASDEDQVRPLLPAGPGCAVIVTSRRQLAGLAAIEGARVLTMDVLAGPEACELLAARLGTQRAKAEPEAVAELAELCGRLPLALGIIAARVATGPPVPLARHATELRGSRGRLDALDAGGATADVRTVFSWSDQRLSGGAARMFRLLGLHPGPDIGLPAAASLAALTRRQCRVTLAELIRASLISEHSPGRFAVHDLLHAYAAELADAMPEAERQAAIRRMLDHYLHSSVTAALLLFQIDPPGRPPPPEPGTAPERPADRGEAYAWFDGERPVLLALIHQAGLRGYHAHSWWLASALREFFLRRARWQDLITTQQIALAAADKLGDPGKRAAAHRYLGATLSRMDRYQESQYQLRLAMELYRGLGDQLGEARIEFQLCLIPYRQGEWSEALAHGRRSRLLALACGRPADEAYALSTAGWCYGLLGQTRLALAYCERALRLHRQVGSGLGESLTLQILGCVRLRTGDHRGAVTLLRQAADVCRTTGDRYHLADMLDDLGDAHLAAGNRESARDCWRQALATFEDLGLQPRAAQARAKLAASA